MGSGCLCGDPSTGYNTAGNAGWQSNSAQALGIPGFYSGAVNQKLFNGTLNGKGEPGCGSSCGSCYELQTTGSNAYGPSSSFRAPDGGSTIKLMTVDSCYNTLGTPNWCSDNSGTKTDDFDCGVHFDIQTESVDKGANNAPAQGQDGSKWAGKYANI